MCQKVQPRCCHCANPQGHYWEYCVSFQVTAKFLVFTGGPDALPDPEDCSNNDLTVKDVPVLYGCEDNDRCISWFATVVKDFANYENDEIRRARQLAAEEFDAQRNDNFVEQFCSRAYYAPLKKPVSFMEMARRDVESAFEDSADDECGIYDQPRRGQSLGVRFYGRQHPAPMSQRRHRFQGPLSQSAINRHRKIFYGASAVEMLIDETSELSTKSTVVPVFSRPRRMETFRRVKPTAPYLTKGNALLTLYSHGAPLVRDWVTRVEICNEPKYTAAESLGRHLKSQEAKNKRFWSAPSLSAIRSKVSNMFKH
ncbi:hypothetical protein B0T10DRAFT_452559 [Thelonectria olida]|uniref:Uncharacterized protein n=1 Tax=Thelonectria olida TaxID=1576542 RepID=A0A9P8WI90_9HYPO|nr:hypothetical protein B0T10DRAFT_452559 [Thelonectria olida]